MVAEDQLLRDLNELVFLNNAVISVSIAAPETNRMVEKLAASMIVLPKDSRQNT
jgi:hypothetical protein